MSGRLRWLRSPSGAIGCAILLFVLVIACLGPALAPHSPTAPVGAPLTGPSGTALLGTDFLGRDVLSRLLNGGSSVIGLAAAATALAYLIGLWIGLVAGYSRSIVDPLLMRTVDVMLAFPPLLFLLVLITGAGSSVAILIVGVAVIQAPQISRIVRTATLEVSVRGYVEAAIARGERAPAVVVREILPNILAPILVDAGLRFTFSILIIASVNFLGLGLQPPSSDWARLIGENRSYISENSLAVVAPAVMIAILTIGINLTGDAIARSLGRSYVPRTVRSVSAGGAAAAIRVQGLSLGLHSGEAVVEDVSFNVAPGEILGVVGESGSGKTTVALALLGYMRPGVELRAGTIEVGGQSILGRDARGLRGLRGKVISYVAQDPGGALNPSMRVGEAILDVLRAHRTATASDELVRAALARVELGSDPTIGRRYPHQLSGGQQQRVTIAMATVCEPAVAVLDEPTTGLDVLTQDRILLELTRLRDEEQMAMVYVSHDLAVVARMADRVLVKYAGRVLEHGPTEAVIEHPRHPYTQALVAAIPDVRRPRALHGIPGVSVGVGEWPAGCAFAPRCGHTEERCHAGVPALVDANQEHSVRCVRWDELALRERLADTARASISTVAGAPLLEVSSLQASYRSGRHANVVVHDLSFGAERGQCVALVGESGSGKSTVGRCIAGLHVPSAGRISFDGQELAGAARSRPLDVRRRIQIVFQNPFESLNPRHRVRSSIERPLRVLRRLSRGDATREVGELLERVRLPRRLAERFPLELSGGERRRVAIARALAAQPDLLICDEVTSALDVSVQAAVLELLQELRRELNLSLLFITHNLGVVACMADVVLVVERGTLRETGRVDEVLSMPGHDYTRRLL